MIDTFVALDLETTGTNPGTDQIIEVAAVRFRLRLPVESFHSLVNPRYPLSEYIQRLTGIAPSQLASAPSFDQVAERLQAFLGESPLVGHNLAFDLGFLAAQGMRPPGPVYDTYHLGTLLFPQLPEYGLAALAAFLGINVEERHRALPHAMAAGNLLLALQALLSHLEPAVGAEIARLASRAGVLWMHLFQDFSGGPVYTAEQFCTQAWGEAWEKPLVSGAAASPQPVDSEAVARLLEPGGALEKALSGFEHRPEQVHMARAVAESLSQGQHLMVEAGTGTGKSLAYLLPAMNYALQNQAPIVLSTNTINLQEQLVGKDIPQLQAALSQFQGVRIATLKGRANYLCLWRWDTQRHSLVLSPEEALFLSRILVWLGWTRTGDRAELHLLPQEAGLWNTLSAIEENCTPETCPFHFQNHCFLYLARRRAESAHLVITNHALLLTDMVLGTRLLPQSNHLIIDEAHRLEEEATAQLGQRLTSRQLGQHLDQLERRPGIGLLAQVLACGSTQPSLRRPPLGALMEESRRLLQQARSRGEHFFQALERFAAEQGGSGGDYELRCRLTSTTRAQPSWSALEIVGENLALALQGLGDGVSRLHLALEDLPSPMAGVASQMASFVATNSQMVERLKGILFNRDKGYIYWLAAREDEVSLNSAPLRVGPLLESSLYSQKKSVILTSATMSIQGSLAYMQERLGLASARELLLGSSFNYPASVLVYALQGIPEPDRPGYSREVEEALVALARASHGRTLALFTSHGALRTALDAVRPKLEAEGIPVMGQGIDGSPRQLQAAFQNHSQALLLGTSSFWEGVDMSEGALSLLVIPRLPFPVPTDPIVAARYEAMEDGFNSYYLPLAILRLKQGFGRLIRRRSDRGAVVILDSRLHSRSYGQAFLTSLPPATLKKGPLRLMVEEVKKWLS